MEQVKILQVLVGGPNINGIASFLYQYYKNMNQETIHFDFLIIRENALISKMDDPIFKESKFYVLNAIKSNGKTDYLKMVKGIESTLNSNVYNAVHINTLDVVTNVIAIHLCKRNKINVIISHSHNEYSVGIKPAKKLVHKLFQPYIRRKADYLFACSGKAGICLFGEKGIRQSNFRVIPNAIDMEKFDFSIEQRNRTRKENNISQEIVVIGQIGRLSAQKNQMFALEVFSEYHKLNPKSVFWIVGNGSNEEELIEKAIFLNLQSNVVFMGQRNDVSSLLNAMDALLFPSKWEGLGIALIEAQSTGIPILASNQIPKETEITDLIHFMPLSSGSAAWAAQLLDITKQCEFRSNRHKCIVDHHYSIKIEANKMEEFYKMIGNA